VWWDILHKLVDREALIIYSKVRFFTPARTQSYLSSVSNHLSCSIVEYPPGTNIQEWEILRVTLFGLLLIKIAYTGNTYL